MISLCIHHMSWIPILLYLDLHYSPLDLWFPRFICVNLYICMAVWWPSDFLWQMPQAHYSLRSCLGEQKWICRWKWEKIHSMQSGINWFIRGYLWKHACVLVYGVNVWLIVCLSNWISKKINERSIWISEWMRNWVNAKLSEWEMGWLRI